MFTFQRFWPACSRSRLLGFALCLSALALSACSLAGDVTPPPGNNTSISSAPGGTAQAVGTPPTSAAAQPTSVTSASYPDTKPASLDGGLLYQQHCAPCHGDNGAGDGSMATQLPTKPPDFSNPATLRAQTPQLIFNTITQGNTQALMPPFAGTLTDAQRWSVVSFLYTLSTPANQLAAGQVVYTANCARCHGTDGTGHGSDAAQSSQPLPSFADQAFMASKSQLDFFKVVSGGDAAHPFTNLSETDRWAALDAVRAFAYTYTAPDQLTAEHNGSVTGKVVNSTPQGSVPAGLAVTLHGFDGQNLLGTYTTTIGADGGFQFAAVPFTASRQFIATADYQGVSYASQVGTFDVSTSALSLTLPIYETTTDPASLTVDQVHMFLEFNSPNAVTVGQLFIFSNNGNRTFAASQANPLSFNVPAGASNVNVQNAQLDKSFFVDGSTLSVLSSVPPGQSSAQVLFSFNLPYTDKLAFQQKMNYPVSNVDVLVSDLGVQLTGSQIKNQGTQNFQGQAFQDFGGGALTTGQSLDFQVSGKAGTGATAATGVLNSSTGTLAIGLGALALVLTGIGVWLYRRPRVKAATARTRTDLVEAIAELDDAFDAGQVTEAEYHKERDELKRELKRVWN